MRRHAAFLLAAACALGVEPTGVRAAQPECGASLDALHRRVASSPAYRLAFAPLPAPWATGRHFALDIAVCPGAGQPLPQALKVDADMPAHRHGMNYRPTVQALGDGRFRADGLMLHMPGRWRLSFDLVVDGRTQRLQHELDLP